jgi:hypothetical protein
VDRRKNVLVRVKDQGADKQKIEKGTNDALPTLDKRESGPAFCRQETAQDR